MTRSLRLSLTLRSLLHVVFLKNVNQNLSPPLVVLDIMFIYIYNTLPYLTPEVLNTFFYALIYLLSYIVNINLKFYCEKLVQLLFSSSAISLMPTFTASAASRFGRKAGVSGLQLGHFLMRRFASCRRRGTQ